jgi:uncharacterized protein (TIGR03437 family)
MKRVTLGSTVLAVIALSTALRSAGPALNQNGVVDAIGFSREVAPGSIIALFGSALADSTFSSAAAVLPTQISGVSVELQDNGAVTRLPLLFVSEGQINGHLPLGLAGPIARLRVLGASGDTGWRPIAVVPASPRIVVQSTGGGSRPVVLHADNSFVTDANPAVPDETLVMYLGGLGPAAGGSNSIEVTLGGRPAPIAYAGLAPGSSVAYQINFRVPPLIGAGSHALFVRAGLQSSQSRLRISVTRSDGDSTRQYFVAPHGTPQGDGSRDNPWDLASALQQPAGVGPGDTIWLLGGKYGSGRDIFTSTLTGTRDRPILVRQALGERATIDGGLMIRGGHTWFSDFEVTCTLSGPRNDARQAPDGIVVHGPGTKLINLVVHDTNQGISVWEGAVAAEVYGNLIYYNGFQGESRGHGHGLYTQNQNSIKVIRDNILFSGFAVGIHAYGSENAYVEGYDVEGNVVFNNGALSARGERTDNILFAGGRALRRIKLLNNFTYHTPDAEGGYSRMGWVFGGANEDVTIRDNYWMGGHSAVELWNWRDVVYENNRVYSKDSLIQALARDRVTAAPRYLWDENTYYGSGLFRFNGKNYTWDEWKQMTGLDGNSNYRPGRPTGVWTFVRPNQFDTSRATIIVYNWDMRPSVSADVSAVLKQGEEYEVRDAQNYFGAPVASGTFSGREISIAFAGLQPAAPVGQVPAAPRHTAPEFAVFIVTRK